MKLDSEYFDSIRVGKTKGKGKGKSGGRARPAGAARAETESPVCAWEGCEKPGTHKAPLGRDHEGQYVHFCIDHVREYNKSYNYFSGLDDSEIQKHLKDSLTGNRPTWSMGRSGSARSETAEAARSEARQKRWNGRVEDPFEFFSEEEQATQRPRAPRRKLRSLETKAFETLDVAQDASGEEIRARYKDLVKQLHPDANGGDRGTEDKLREVIQAYKLLKQSGFC